MRRRNNDKNGSKELYRAIDTHERLAEFEKFEQEILPALRADVLSGMTAAEIYKKYQSHAAARGVSIALTSQDEGKAAALIKDMLDRGDGKAVERRETRHKFENLTDEELDSYVMSRMEEDLEDGDS